MNVTLGLGQILVEGGAREANLRRAEEAIRELARKGADLVLLPEAMNLGWTHPSCHTDAEPIPGGVTCQLLQRLAIEHGIYLVAGIVERDMATIYNSAVIISPSGEFILRHRKINELEIAHDCYSRGTSLRAVGTPLGRLGLMICADGFTDQLAISRALAQMGAEIILSPCAWAVQPEFDQLANPYGQIWLDSYAPVCSESNLWIAGCSNVGPIEAGPWKGHRCIGNSLVMGPGGKPTLTGPYNESSALVLHVRS